MHDRGHSYAIFFGQGSAHGLREHFYDGDVVNRVARDEPKLPVERRTDFERHRIGSEKHTHT